MPMCNTCHVRLDVTAYFQTTLSMPKALARRNQVAEHFAEDEAEIRLSFSRSPSYQELVNMHGPIPRSVMIHYLNGWRTC